MEQHAPEYNRAPHEWRLSEHITTPRKSCDGLPRQYAPPERVPGDDPDATDDDFYAIGQVYLPYGHIFRTAAGWQGKYSHRGKVIHTPARKTTYDAALAYNAAIKAAGLDSKRLIDLDSDESEAVA